MGVGKAEFGGQGVGRAREVVEFDWSSVPVLEKYLDSLKLTRESWQLPTTGLGVAGFVTDLPRSGYAGQNIELVKMRSAVYWELHGNEFRLVALVANMGRLSEQQVRAAVWYAGLKILDARSKGIEGTSVNFQVKYQLPDFYPEHDGPRFEAAVQAVADCYSCEGIVRAFTRATRSVSEGNKAAVSVARGGRDDGNLLK